MRKKYFFLKLKETQIRFELYVQDKYFMDEMNYYGKKRLVLHVFREIYEQSRTISNFQVLMTLRHILMVTNLEIKFIGFIGLGRFLEEKLAYERFRYFQSKISVQMNFVILSKCLL